MFAPYVDDVVGEGRAGRAVVVETGDTTVDVERGRIEVFVLQWLLLAQLDSVGAVALTFISCSKAARSKGLPLWVVVSLGMATFFRWGRVTLYRKRGGVDEKCLVG